jgi:hypothetical protein
MFHSNTFYNNTLMPWIHKLHYYCTQYTHKRIMMCEHISHSLKPAKNKPCSKQHITHLRYHVNVSTGLLTHSGIHRNFFHGVQQIQLRTEGRENGDLEAVAPSQGFHSICKWVKSAFWLCCYGCIFHGTENSAQLCQNFGIWGGGVLNPPNSPPPPR